MRRPTPARALLLGLLLWMAQVQGVVHAIGHLGQTHTTQDLLGKHSISCAECAAFAQAGAAPTSAAAPLVILLAAQPPHLPPALVPALRATPAAYRSRAPPVLS